MAASPARLLRVEANLLPPVSTAIDRLPPLLDLIPRLAGLESGSPSARRLDPSPRTDLPSDPGLRPRITDYHPNDRNQVRRAYAQRGTCQPKEHIFPYKTYGAKDRRFNKGWFTQFNWLEYSIAKDAAFCLCCYLFKSDIGEQAGGDTFVSEGFSNWKCPKKLKIHEGGINSSHRQASRMCDDLLKPNQSIQSFHFKQTDQARIEYRTRLNASIDCIRFLLRQGLAFRGHDESEDSSNQGNFLELLRFLADHNEDIKAVTLRNALENNMLISPAIQKDIRMVQPQSKKEKQNISHTLYNLLDLCLIFI
uniref:TTF-type domain-containing protein n=1 Tax=Fagus sylvatica TaxID=28930 RepID=A0A2N9H4F1_FAGSY